MAKAQWCGGYEVAQQLLDRCLRRDGSLFTESPSREIWTLDLAEELDGRVGAPDESPGSFIEKLDGQLAGLDTDAIQLASELLYFELLAESDTGGDTKEEHIEHILGMTEGTMPIPKDLRAALSAGGVANYGPGKSNRDAFMRFLVRFVIDWKARDPEEQQRLADSPWAVLDLVNEIRTSTDGMQANALLHLLYPEDFEYMIAPNHRQKLIATFAGAPGVADAQGEDRQIQAIRTATTKSLGREAQLYEEWFKRIWSEPASPQWRELIKWARRLHEWSRFDEEERDYKLRLAQKLAEARASDGAEWPKKLKRAFHNKDNNLTAWQSHDKFLTWCEEHPDEARTILDELWDAGDDPQTAVAGFLDAMPDEAVRGPGARLTIATFLLLGSNPTGAPFYKHTVHRRFLRLVDRSVKEPIEIEPDTVYRPKDLAATLGVDPRTVRRFLRERYPRETEDKGEDWMLVAAQAQIVVDRFDESADSSSALSDYASWLRALEELRLRLLGDGFEIRDFLDAQSLAYWLTIGPPEEWSEEDKRAYYAFRDGPDAEVEPIEPKPEPAGVVALADATAGLATKTHLPVEWLQDKIDLLAEKKQVIFYGPPGTGKTFVALKLGEHLTAHGGQTRLVQFHPSYTYEDFFEGYRPVDADGGQVKFELVPGPLREMARDAAKHPDQPYLLIVDEINRGNVAKVFGELYFLLEYRDQKIQLQYSRDQPFELPENLFVIGTMNTADRSIALVDSALRRRFYFAGFLPTEEPIRSVLAKWLEANGLQPEPASLLDALNEAIGDKDFSIGQSYFMTAEGRAPDIDRVWEHAVKPLLEEHYYGSGRDIDAEFSPKALEKQLAEAADETPLEDDSDADNA